MCSCVRSIIWDVDFKNLCQEVGLRGAGMDMVDNDLKQRSDKT